MEVKWMCIAFALIALGGIANEVVGNYHYVECKQALASTTAHTAADIDKMCSAK